MGTAPLGIKDPSCSAPSACGEGVLCWDWVWVRSFPGSSVLGLPPMYRPQKTRKPESGHSLLWAVSLGALLLAEEGRQEVSCKHCRFIDYILLTTIWCPITMVLFTVATDEIGSVASILCVFNSQLFLFIYFFRPVVHSSNLLPHWAVTMSHSAQSREDMIKWPVVFWISWH